MGRDHERERLFQALRGDRDAFATLFDTYFRRVFSFTRSRVGSDERAQRLTERVLAELFDTAPRLASRRSDALARLALVLTRSALEAERDSSPRLRGGLGPAATGCRATDAAGAVCRERVQGPRGTLDATPPRRAPGRKEEP